MSELVAISDRLVGYDRVVWAVPDSAQTASLLQKERGTGRVVFIPDIQPRDLWSVLTLVPLAYRVIRSEAPTMVLSTGASPAIPFLVLGMFRGANAHYVESLARLDAPSVTGRVLRRVRGVHTHTQHSGLNWTGWSCVGSTFDRYSVEKRRRRGGPLRVVVSVGTMKDFEFGSLLRRVRDLLPADAETVWQTGATDVSSLGLDGAREWIAPDEMRRAMSNADVVICHAGVGTVMDALSAGRLPVVVPRRENRHEHVDDHQQQVATWLYKRGLAIATELDDLDIDHLTDAAACHVTADGPLPPPEL